MSACLGSSLEAGLRGQALGTQILRHQAPLLQGEVAAVADLEPAEEVTLLGATTWSSPELALSPSSSGQGGTDGPYWSGKVRVPSLGCISPLTGQPANGGIHLYLSPQRAGSSLLPLPTVVAMSGPAFLSRKRLLRLQLSRN